MPAYESAGVSLALETYEQLSSRDLVTLVEAVGSPNLGICLDPANCVAALEHPKAVIDRCAPRQSLRRFLPGVAAGWALRWKALNWGLVCLISIICCGRCNPRSAGNQLHHRALADLA